MCPVRLVRPCGDRRDRTSTPSVSVRAGRGWAVGWPAVLESSPPRVGRGPRSGLTQATPPVLPDTWKPHMEAGRGRTAAPRPQCLEAAPGGATSLQQGLF